MELNMILAGIVGSTAYGMANENSDIDMLGVYQAPTRDVLGLHDVEQSKVGHDPDWQAHELGKLFKLCLSCNPTVSEILWLPEELYAIRTPAADAVIDIRQGFLSTKAFKSYGGYARQQFHRLKADGNVGFDADKRTPEKIAKHGRHLARLVLQGAHLMMTGEILVRLEPQDRDFCFSIGDRVGEFERIRLEQGELTEAQRQAAYGEVEELLDWYDFLGPKSILPAQPDLEGVNKVLVDLRLADLGAM